MAGIVVDWVIKAWLMVNRKPLRSMIVRAAIA